MQIFRSDLAKKMVIAAGEMIVSLNPQDGVVQKEGRGNIVTAADKASEKIIVDLIRETYPVDSILSEETESKENDLLAVDHLWIIDPIDGTNNYRYQRHYSAVSIGYAEKGILQIAAVFDPFRKDLFFAEKGKGSTLNGQRIHVSAVNDIHQATVAADNSYDPAGTRKNIELVLRIDPSPWILMKGSSVLGMCDVACGRNDLYVQTCLKPWDTAAAMLIVQEAGGVVTDLQGNQISFLSPEVVAGNTFLVSQFLRKTAP